jgi:hypothetical protein
MESEQSRLAVYGYERDKNKPNKQDFTAMKAIVIDLDLGASIADSIFSDYFLSYLYKINIKANKNYN